MDLTHRFAERIGTPGSLDDLLTAFVDVVLRETGWTNGCIWRYHDGMFVPHVGCPPGAPALPLSAAGIARSAWQERTPVWVWNSSQDGLSFPELGSAGSRGAAAFPLLINDASSLVAVFSFGGGDGAEARKRPEVEAFTAETVPILRLRASLDHVRRDLDRVTTLHHEPPAGTIRVHLPDLFCSVSPEVEDLLQLEHGSLSGPLEGLLQWMHPDDRSPMEHALQEAMVSGVLPGRTSRWRDAGGTPHRLEASGALSRVDGGGEHLLITLRTLSTSSPASALEDAVGRLGDLVKQRSATLEDARIRAQRILDTITDCSFTLDPDRCITEVNARAVAFFGRTRETLLGTSCAALFPGDEGAAMLSALDVAERTGTPEHLEAFCVPAGRWAALHLSPTSGGIVVYFADITARRTAEDALRRSEERFRSLLDQSRDVVLMVDLERKELVYVSASALEVLGFSPEEVITMGRAALMVRVHEEDRDQVTAALLPEGTSRPGATEAHEFRWLHKSGNYRWMHGTRTNVGSEGGPAWASVMTLRDVTLRRQFIDELTAANRELQREIERRKRTEQMLEESERSYRSMLEQQADLFTRVRGDGRLVYVNPAYCAFFGKERDDLLGGRDHPVIHPEDLGAVHEQLAGLTPQHDTLTLENRVLNVEGEFRWVQWTIRGFFADDGRLTEYQCTGRDVTKRRHAELLLSVQYEITLALADSPTLLDAVDRVLRLLGERLGWDVVLFWRVERGAKEPLRFEALWHREGIDPVLVEHSLTRDLDIPRGVNDDARPVWIEDVQALPGEGEHAGFRSVLAFPARVGDTLTAVVECLSAGPRLVHQDEIDAMEAVGHQVGNYRERKMGEEALRRAAEELEWKVRQRTDQLATALTALSNSETRFRAMFEGAPMGIALFGRNGVITERNPTLESMLGYAPGSLHGGRFEDLVHPDDREMVTAMVKRLFAGRATHDAIEVRFVRIDGAAVWGSMSAAAMALGEGGASFIIAMIKDVTERKTIEHRLRESENRARTVFENAPIGIALITASGAYSQVNQAFADMLGYEREELEGKTLEDVLLPDDLQEDRRCLRAMVAGNLQRYQLQRRYLRKDGTIAWGNLNATVIRSASGEFLFGLRLVEDVTRKRETEQQIRMFAHTITSMNESVVITDTNYRILLVNNAFLRTFGFEESEIIGQNVRVLTPPGTGKREGLAIVSGTLEGGWTGEVEAARRNGAVITVHLSTSVVRDEQGRPVALVGIARDISDHRRLQRELEHAETRRSEDLRRFASSVQRVQEEERQRISRELHDGICQRLSGMKLNLEVVEDSVKASDRKLYRTLRGFRKQFEVAIAEVRRLSSNLRPAVLDDFGLTIALNLLTREFEKNHKIKIHVEAPEEDIRHLDPQVEIALYRIAQEGLANIATHSHATHARLTLHHLPHAVEMVVGDNGRGFGSEEASRAHAEGHGLGLISMRERAELLGGTFALSSKRQHGTEIKVVIPLTGDAPDEEDPDPHR